MAPGVKSRTGLACFLLSLGDESVLGILKTKLMNFKSLVMRGWECIGHLELSTFKFTAAKGSQSSKRQRKAIKKQPKLQNIHTNICTRFPVAQLTNISPFSETAIPQALVNSPGPLPVFPKVDTTEPSVTRSSTTRSTHLSLQTPSKQKHDSVTRIVPWVVKVIPRGLTSLVESLPVNLRRNVLSGLKTDTHFLWRSEINTSHPSSDIIMLSFSVLRVWSSSVYHFPILSPAAA